MIYKLILFGYLLTLFTNSIVNNSSDKYNNGYYQSYIQDIHDEDILPLDELHKNDLEKLEKLGMAHFQRAVIYEKAHYFSLIILKELMNTQYENSQNNTTYNHLNEIIAIYNGNRSEDDSNFINNVSRKIIAKGNSDEVCDNLFQEDCQLYQRLSGDEQNYQELYLSLNNENGDNRTNLVEHLVKLNVEEKVNFIAQKINRLYLLSVADLLLSYEIFKLTENERKNVSLFKAGKHTLVETFNKDNVYLSALEYSNLMIRNNNDEDCTYSDFEVHHLKDQSIAPITENHSILTFTLPFMMDCGVAINEESRDKFVAKLSSKVFNRHENNAQLIELLLYLGAEEKAINIAKDNISRADYYRYEKIRPITLATLSTLFYLNPTTDHWRESRHLFSLLEDEFSELAVTGTILQLATITNSENNNKIYIE